MQYGWSRRAFCSPAMGVCVKLGAATYTGGRTRLLPRLRLAADPRQLHRLAPSAAGDTALARALRPRPGGFRRAGGLFLGDQPDPAGHGGDAQLHVAAVPGAAVGVLAARDSASPAALPRAGRRLHRRGPAAAADADARAVVGGVLGLASGVSAGVAYLNVRRLGELGEPEWRTVFYFRAMGDAGRPAMVRCRRTAAMRVDLRATGWLLLGVGGFGTAAQLCMTARLQARQDPGGGKPGLQHGGVFQHLRPAAVGRVAALAAWGGIVLIVASGVGASLRSRAAPTSGLTPPPHTCCGRT